MSAHLHLFSLVLAFAAAQVPEKELSIYYDLEWKPVPLLTDGVLKEHTLRYGLLPCTCQDYTCGCCLNMNINFANFKRSGCMNFTYLPLDFAIEMNVLMNDESVFKRNVSAKNPPPFCMEVPINYLPAMQFCVKVFDIYTPGRNLHMCVDFETRIERAPILILQFDCFQMGCDGLSNLKPTQSSVAVRGGATSTDQLKMTGLCSTGEEGTDESSNASEDTDFRLSVHNKTKIDIISDIDETNTAINHFASENSTEMEIN